MLTLIPASRELMPFRQALLADAVTMAYNAPWCPPDGTLSFPKENWDAWLARWTNQEPERFCGYVINESNTPVGEVCWYDHGAGMGVVIHADHRGKGYGAKALQLLIARAFSHPEVARLENQFESTRAAAMRTHLDAGFAVTGTDENGSTVLTLTREAYQEHRFFHQD